MIVLLVFTAAALMVLGAASLLAVRTRRLNAAAKARARHRAETPAFGLTVATIGRSMEQLS